MINVSKKRAPPGFKAKVSIPGRKFLSRCPNPTSKQWSSHAYWRVVFADLHHAYYGVCAYLSCPVNPEGAEVDHFLPKSKYPKQAYRWSNYRLASVGINRNKGQRRVLDPFAVKPDSFRMNLLNGAISPSGIYDGEYLRLCENTVRWLDLDAQLAREMRLQALDGFLDGSLEISWICNQYPFVGSEIMRHGLNHVHRVKIAKIFDCLNAVI